MEELYASRALAPSGSFTDGIEGPMGHAAGKRAEVEIGLRCGAAAAKRMMPLGRHLETSAKSAPA